MSFTMRRHKLFHCTRDGYIPCYRPAPWRSAQSAPPNFARGTQTSLGYPAHRPSSSTLCQPYIVRTHGVCKVGLLRRTRDCTCVFTFLAPVLLPYVLAVMHGCSSLAAASAVAAGSSTSPLFFIMFCGWFVFAFCFCFYIAYLCLTKWSSG